MREIAKCQSEPQGIFVRLGFKTFEWNNANNWSVDLFTDSPVGCCLRVSSRNRRCESKQYHTSLLGFYDFYKCWRVEGVRYCGQINHQYCIVLYFWNLFFDFCGENVIALLLNCLYAWNECIIYLVFPLRVGYGQ